MSRYALIMSFFFKLNYFILPWKTTMEIPPSWLMYIIKGTDAYSAFLSLPYYTGFTLCVFYVTGPRFSWLPDLCTTGCTIKHHLGYNSACRQNQPPKGKQKSNPSQLTVLAKSINVVTLWFGLYSSASGELFLLSEVCQLRYVLSVEKLTKEKLGVTLSFQIPNVVSSRWLFIG